MSAAQIVTDGSVAAVARRAREAARVLARLSADARNEVLLAAAAAIEANKEKILAANALDIRDAEAAVDAGKMSAAMLKRLRTSEQGVAQDGRAGAANVAALPDPLGRRLSATELDEGLVLYKESCPLGVVGIIFEARPEVVPQVGSLALKSGKRSS